MLRFTHRKCNFTQFLHPVFSFNRFHGKDKRLLRSFHQESLAVLRASVAVRSLGHADTVAQSDDLRRVSRVCVTGNYKQTPPSHPITVLSAITTTAPRYSPFCCPCIWTFPAFQSRHLYIRKTPAVRWSRCSPGTE